MTLPMEATRESGAQEGGRAITVTSAPRLVPRGGRETLVPNIHQVYPWQRGRLLAHAWELPPHCPQGPHSHLPACPTQEGSPWAGRAGHWEAVARSPSPPRPLSFHRLETLQRCRFKQHHQPQSVPSGGAGLCKTRLSHQRGYNQLRGKLGSNQEGETEHSFAHHPATGRSRRGLPGLTPRRSPCTFLTAFPTRW